MNQNKGHDLQNKRVFDFSSIYIDFIGSICNRVIAIASQRDIYPMYLFNKKVNQGQTDRHKNKSEVH